MLKNGKTNKNGKVKKNYNGNNNGNGIGTGYRNGRNLSTTTTPDDLDAAQEPIMPRCVTIMELSKSASTEKMLRDMLMQQEEQERKLRPKQRRMKRKGGRKIPKQQMMQEFEVYDQQKPYRLSKLRSSQPLRSTLQQRSSQQQRSSEQQQRSTQQPHRNDSNAIRCRHCGENLVTEKKKGFWYKLTSCFRSDNDSSDDDDDNDESDLNHNDDRSGSKRRKSKEMQSKISADELLQQEFIKALQSHEELNLNSLRPADVSAPKRKYYDVIYNIHYFNDKCINTPTSRKSKNKLKSQKLKSNGDRDHRRYTLSDTESDDDQPSTSAKIKTGSRYITEVKTPNNRSYYGIGAERHMIKLSPKEQEKEEDRELEKHLRELTGIQRGSHLKNKNVSSSNCRMVKQRQRVYRESKRKTDENQNRNNKKRSYLSDEDYSD